MHPADPLCFPREATSSKDRLDNLFKNQNQNAYATVFIECDVSGNIVLLTHFSIVLV